MIKHKFKILSVMALATFLSLTGINFSNQNGLGFQIINSYAAEIGDTVTPEIQTDVNGVLLPQTGAAIDKIYYSGSKDNATAVEYIYSDGTSYITAKTPGIKGVILEGSFYSAKKGPVIIDNDSISTININIFDNTKIKDGIFFKNPQITSVTFNGTNYRSWKGTNKILNSDLYIKDSVLGFGAFTETELDSLTIENSSIFCNDKNTSGEGSFKKCTIGNLKLIGNVKCTKYNDTSSELRYFTPFIDSTIENFDMSELTSNCERLFTGLNLKGTDFIWDRTESSRSIFQDFTCNTLYFTNEEFILGNYPTEIKNFGGSAIYLIGDIKSEYTLDPSNVPNTINWHGRKGSKLEATCKANNYSFTPLTNEEIESIVNGNYPSILTQSELFNKQNPEDINIRYSLGSGKLAAKSIKQVIINNKVLNDTDWETKNNLLTIKKNVFEPLQNGEYKIFVEFDTKYVIDDKIKVTVIGDSIVLPPEMTIPEQMKVVDASKLEDVYFTVYCNNIDMVILDTKQLKNTDYTLTENSLKQRAGNINQPKILKINKDVLNGLQPGEHKILVVTEGITIRDKLSIFISGNGADITPPEAMETLSYYFYKDYQKNILVPIKMNSATDIVTLKIGEVEVPRDAYVFQENAIIINKEYLANQPTGVYRLLPTFNDVKHTTIPNLVIEIYNKFEERLLPHLLPSYIEFSKSNKPDSAELEFKMFMGSGNSLAKTAKLLVIDDKFILPDGNTVSFKSNEENLSTHNLASPSEARYEAKYMVASSSDAEFFIDNETSILYDVPVFYTKGDTLYVSVDYIEGLDLSIGEHRVGVIFDNEEETASLDKAIINIIKDNDNPYPEEPEDPEEPEEPGKPEEPEDPGKPDTPNNGGNGSSGGGGGSSSGMGGTSKTPSPNCDFNTMQNTKGFWKQDEIGWWYVKEDGSLPTGWIKVNELIYYISPTTGYMHTGWLLDNSKWYYLEETNESGRLLRSEWLLWKNNWWYLQSCGQMKSNDWLLYKDSWYYLGENGHMLFNQWNEVKNKWYFMNVDGKMETKKIIWEGYLYIMDSNGASDYTGPSE